MAASIWAPSWPIELLGGRPLPMAVPSILGLASGQGGGGGGGGPALAMRPAQSCGGTTRLGCVVQHHHQQHEAILAVPKDRHLAMLLKDWGLIQKIPGLCKGS